MEKKDKTLVIILAGRGSGCKYDEDKYKKSFHSNEKQDVVAFVDSDKHLDWKPKNFKVVHNISASDMFEKDSVSSVSAVRNFTLRWADQHGYSKVWMFDDNFGNMKKWPKITKEDYESKKKIEYELWPELPEIEHMYGGLVNSNFIKLRLQRDSEYTHMMPMGIHYWDLAQMKEKLGEILYFETKELLWEDYDYNLKLLKLLNYQRKTFIRWTCEKASTQDERVHTGGLFSVGVDKTTTLGFNLYKRWGSENVYALKRVNMVDVHIHRNLSKIRPVVHRWRTDSLDNYLQDILDDTDTKYVKDSVKARTTPYEWLHLIKNPDPRPPETFKFGGIG